MHITHFSRLAAAGLSLALTTSAVTAQVTTSGGDVTSFTQKNLINRLIVGDSMEIEMAQLAVNRTQNAAVREFANQLLTDHKAHLENVQKLAAKTDVGREANAADTSGTHAATTLKSLQGMAADSSFDRAFIQTQIEHHQQTISALKLMRPVAKDADLQADLDKTLPILETHLSRATAIAGQLSKPAGAADTTATGNKPPVAKPPV